jgi:hypothetical protein
LRERLASVRRALVFALARARVPLPALPHGAVQLPLPCTHTATLRLRLRQHRALWPLLAPLTSRSLTHASVRRSAALPQPLQP